MLIKNNSKHTRTLLVLPLFVLSLSIGFTAEAFAQENRAQVRQERMEQNRNRFEQRRERQQQRFNARQDQRLDRAENRQDAIQKRHENMAEKREQHIEDLQELRQDRREEALERRKDTGRISGMSAVIHTRTYALTAAMTAATCVITDGAPVRMCASNVAAHGIK